MPQITHTIPNDGAVSSISTTSVQILPTVSPVQIRTEWSIQNTSTGGQTISLAYDKDATASQGIVLTANTGIFQSIDSASIPFQGKITAISSAAGGSVAFHELRANKYGS